jgi:hypothetical protein
MLFYAFLLLFEAFLRLFNAFKAFSTFFRRFFDAFDISHTRPVGVAKFSRAGQQLVRMCSKVVSLGLEKNTL